MPAGFLLEKKDEAKKLYACALLNATVLTVQAQMARASP
jgi:hypothetical protein